MGEKIHFWADIKNDFRPSCETLADEHSGEDEGISVQLTSLENLKSELNILKTEGRMVDMMDFHTHGSKGAIYMGSEILNNQNVELILHNQGFDGIFNPEAIINFDGCNVGEGYQGEFFLALVARILLGSVGGKVMGSTGVGIGMPMLVKIAYISPFGIGGALIPMTRGESPHPLGDWVTAYVSIGGSVRLENHTFLIAERIKERIKDGETRLVNIDETTETMGHLIIARSHLNSARNMVPEENLTPSFRRMHNACYYLERLEASLDTAAAINRSQSEWRFPKF